MIGRTVAIGEEGCVGEVSEKLLLCLEVTQ